MEVVGYIGMYSLNNYRLLGRIHYVRMGAPGMRTTKTSPAIYLTVVSALRKGLTPRLEKIKLILKLVQSIYSSSAKLILYDQP